MKPEIKDRWVSALRSGDYQQGRGALRLNDEYCCLGVLCEMAVEEGIVSRIQPDFSERDLEMYGADEIPTHAYMEPSGDSEVHYLPTAVQEWADVDFNPSIQYEDDDNIGGTHRGEQFRYLSTLNDQGKEFKEIADLIEEYL